MQTPKTDTSVEAPAPAPEPVSLALKSLLHPEGYLTARISLFFALPTLHALSTYFLRLQLSIFEVLGIFAPIYLFVFWISQRLKEAREDVLIGPISPDTKIKVVSEPPHSLRVYFRGGPPKIIHCANSVEQKKFVIQLEHTFSVNNTGAADG
jgi:hypothetical protein